ncbi:MAG: CarD family transcriptional regulator [Clostridia bacterium]|nr:CarD family transcriptional regulator [Clostridia bacterium]
MFDIGDKIVYPLHGAGVIESIVEKEILGQKKKYYVMRIHSGNMTVLIPMDNCEEIGVRYVIDADEAKKVMDYFKNEPLYDDNNWNRRQRENMSKIKSGNIYRVLDVLKDLMYRERKKGLSTSERKILGNAKQIVVSELVMSNFAGREDIELIMDSIVDRLLVSQEG